MGVKKAALWVGSLLAASGAAAGATYEVTRRNLECRKNYQMVSSREGCAMVNFDKFGEYLRSMPRDALVKLLQEPNKN